MYRRSEFADAALRPPGDTQRKGSPRLFLAVMPQFPNWNGRSGLVCNVTGNNFLIRKLYAWIPLPFGETGRWVKYVLPWPRYKLVVGWRGAHYHEGDRARAFALKPQLCVCRFSVSIPQRPWQPAATQLTCTLQTTEKFTECWVTKIKRWVALGHQQLLVDLYLRWSPGLETTAACLAPWLLRCF